MMAFATVIASCSDAWAGTMIGGFPLGGQTCTFQRPASPLDSNMSSAYLWYLADFFSIGCPLGTGSTTYARERGTYWPLLLLARGRTTCGEYGSKRTEELIPCPL